ncbi:3-hydroxyacyl-CoA dehydrogenase family protein [Thermoflavimicrobium daqui]|jgi:3-hydroxybutyryl-CoA dehydrogenase|uniref:3-hydroxybutyryl-CoA dehydrogenase n=1 Tax=Thermoflavimicrobium daqui TaxID=2137476 RepID=A0A364K9R1_9BACL|nr:3-hydroxyacyl-CoA dehydrogenase NAD-binding domain-containing protein [Thermoflavimicrobium daqui]RAL26940.1 3-hydroxybutyryl-CoA dehydrogenase [Thermoflavimicrobium daqui]
MTNDTFHRLAIIGAGTMGLGIAEFLASVGYNVAIYESSSKAWKNNWSRLKHRLSKQVERGKLTTKEMKELCQRIHLVSSLSDLREMDLIIEAVVENIEVKKELFSQLSQIVSDTTILASNTSSLSITEIAAAAANPERVLGLHFFNPAVKMPLVEVIRGEVTELKWMEEVTQWIKEIGKEPVQVADSPGFLVNRVARPFHIESYRLISEGLADKAQVDRILRAAGFKMGPFELQDLIGIDINLAASVSVYRGFFAEPRFRPHYRQQRMMESGALGRKTGKGHFTYES